MKRIQMKPIAEAEGISWDELLELTQEHKPVCEQLPLLFDEAETQDEQLEEQEGARGPPVALYKPEAYALLSANGV